MSGHAGEVAAAIRAIAAQAVQRPSNQGMGQEPMLLRAYVGVVSGAPDGANHTADVKFAGESTARTAVWTARDLTANISDTDTVLVIEIAPQVFVAICRL